MMRRPITLTPLLALVTAAACSGGLGGLGEILTGGTGQPSSGTVTVEIQAVRQQQQQIVVNTSDGQQVGVLYDQNTQVIYENEQYPVTALEYGDVVDMRVQEVEQGYYTDLIQVRQTVQDRQGESDTTAPDVYRIEGTIGEIDLQEWRFTLNMTQGGELPIFLTASASAADRDRLREHLPGDYVRVEVRPIDDQTAELVRWDWDG